MAEPVSEDPAGAPALACVVIGFRCQPGLAEAVRSLTTQRPRPEVVVVNSGGGDAGAAMSAAGLDAPVIDVDRPLTPGAARNVGVEATRARIVAFLAADCLAQPGWVAGRVEAHEGAAAVATALVPAEPVTRSARASHLLLHHRRLPGTDPAERVLNGPSFHRAVLRRHGTFREDVILGEDSDYLDRLSDDVVVWAEGVVTAHRGPATIAALAADQFRRGRARAIVEPRLGGQKSPLLLARLAMVNLRPALRVARSTGSRGNVRTLLTDGPLLALGALSCAAGALSAGIRLPK